MLLKNQLFPTGELILNALYHNIQVVGLVDESGLARAIGLFFYLNLQEKTASIFTPLRDMQGIRMIQLGSLHVSPNGKELDWP